jgi:phytoene dehydrogenase-like protein
MARKVLIIGGGIAGLTAGCYLQKNGFNTEIFESQSTPGGLCTSWKRGDYIVDGCLHWLVGSNPADPIYALWSELIDMESIKFHYYEEFFRVKDRSGKEIIAYANLDLLNAELLRKAPEDKKLITDFINGIRKMKSFPLKFDKAPELYTIVDKLKDSVIYIPYLKTLIRYSKMRIADFASKCKNPLLAKFFNYSFSSEMPVLFILITFSWLDNKNAGYPIGGSLEFSKLFEKKYREWGGKINYNCKVESILTEKAGRHHRASGIKTTNGDQHYSDIIISAADGYSTIFEMLGGKFINDRIKHYYKDFKVFPSFIQVSLGVDKDFRGYPSGVAFPLDQPYSIDPEKEIENIYYRIINYDPTLAPEGKTLISCMVQTYNYKYWQDLRDSSTDKYKQEKQRIADFYIAQLDRELGGIKDKIEMVDVVTPATVIRYTNNWKGSFEGWMVTGETGFNSLPKVLPGLNDFYMTGHWVEPGGGVPAVFFSGRSLAQVINKKYKK